MERERQDGTELEALYISSGDHTRNVMKTQSKQQAELPGVWMNRGITTRERNKKSPSNGRRGQS